MKVKFRNTWTGATFIVNVENESGVEAVKRMDALPSWERA